MLRLLLVLPVLAGGAATPFAVVATARAASDCEGTCDENGCVFADACVPGGAFAIARVVPEATAALNDFAGWTAYGAIDLGVEEGALTSREPESGFSSYLGREIALEPGKRYALRATMRADADADGYLVAYGGGRADYGEALVGPEWQVTTIMIDAGEAASTMIAFYGVAVGGGAVHVKDFALLELVDGYGQYLRVTLVDPAVPATVRSPFVILHGAPYFYDALEPEALAPGVPSAWIDMRVRMPGTNAAFGLLFEGPDGAPLGPVTVRYELAYRPDDGAVVANEVVTSDNGGVGFIGTAYPNPLRFASRLRLISELVADDGERFRARPGFAPAPQASDFASISGTGWFDSWGPSSSLLPVFDLWRDLGLNGSIEMALPELEDALSERGIAYRYLHVGPPSAWLSPGAPYAIDTLPAELEVYWEVSTQVQATFERYRVAPDKLIIDMCDEAYGFYYAGDPTYHAGFREYLKTVALGCEDPGAASCSPAPFGKASWDQVFGFTENDGGVDGARPKTWSVPAARYFYWQMRWWSEATARVYAKTREFWVDKLGAAQAPLISPQIGTPFGSYYTWRGGLETQTLVKAGGMDGYLGEAFVAWNDWCWGEWMGLYAEWIDGVLAPHGIDRRGTYVHFTRGSGAQKALALAARGVTRLSWYLYGPHQVTTGDGLAGLGEPSMESLAIMQDGNRALALAEPALSGTRRVTGGIAMINAQSDPMWWKAEDDLWGYTQAIATDETGAWLALAHGHHAVRFLVEERLPSDLDPETKVLLVQRRHLRSDAFLAIQAWVEAGGTLVVIGEAPTHDELGARVTERDAWLGAKLEPLEVFTQPYRVVFDGGPTVGSPYPRRRLDGEMDEGAKVLASYEDGGAAVIEVVRGAGRVRTAGFLLGHTYLEYTSWCGQSGLPSHLGHFPSYDAATREAMMALVGDVARPAWTDEPMVEAVRLEKDGASGQPGSARPSAGSGVLVLINYSNADLGALAVHVPGVSGPAQALFAGGEVVFDAEGDAVVAVGDVEVLTWDVVDAGPGEDAGAGEGAGKGAGEDAGEGDGAGEGTEAERMRRDDDGGCAGGSSAGVGGLAIALALVRRLDRGRRRRDNDRA